MKTHHEGGGVGRAAMKAGMDRKTARRYLQRGHGPQTPRAPRHWQTHVDAFAAIWPEAVRWLEATPEIEAKALFEHFLGQQPAQVPANGLRTFQRRVTRWRTQFGPPKEVFFPQVREPGASVQVDWTHAHKLGVTLAGVPYPHLLCHVVLPYSNWEWAVPCQSESGLSLKTGLQDAFWRLGGVTPQVQTDHSSTATHQLKRGAAARGFNTEYLALCEHPGTTPHTINPGRPDENGDVEAANQHLKRRLRNHLILRGSSDFASLEAYTAFVGQICTAANLQRVARVSEELPRLRPLPAHRYPDAEEHTARVSSYATARVKNCAYSVPARLINAHLLARVSETTVTFHHAGIEVARYPRALAQQARIDYRHVIASLVRKPGAFARYLYREEMFPRPVFRQAYDQLVAAAPAQADRHYIDLLALAARTDETLVATVLGAMLRAGEVPRADLVEKQLHTTPPSAHALAAFVPELHSYDVLVQEVVA
ncbi:MAG: IS21 family transposase [Lacunisphaera sp.]|nr:IS21 family transposase [Lacunisphaera sp.]